MTQPAEAMAQDAVAPDTSTPPPVAPVAPVKPLTPAELANEIKAAADVEMGDLRKLMHFRWGEAEWSWGKPAPVNTKYIIMAMFHSDEEVRAYAAPFEKGPYLCYVLRKDAPSFGTESMSLATFRESVVDELNALESGMEIRDVGRAEGRDECVAYIRQLSANGGLDATGAALTLEQIAQKLDDEADIDADGAAEEE